MIGGPGKYLDTYRLRGSLDPALTKDITFILFGPTIPLYL